MVFVKPYWKQIAATIVIGILKFGIPLLLPLVMMYIIDDLILNDALSQADKLSTLFWIMGGMFFLFVVIRPPVEYYRQYFAQWIGNKVLFDIRDQLFGHIQKLSLRFYSNRKVGEIIFSSHSRCGTDKELCHYRINEYLARFIYDCDCHYHYDESTFLANNCSYFDVSFVRSVH